MFPPPNRNNPGEKPDGSKNGQKPPQFQIPRWTWLLFLGILLLWSLLRLPDMMSSVSPSQPITIPSGRGSRMLIVAFKKGKAFPFYPFPMSDLADTVAEADLVFGRTFRDLREQLLAANGPARMFQMVERFLLKQAGDAIREDSSTRCIDYALSSIIHRPTLRRLDRLSNDIGYSQKHFIDLFRRRVGVTPKQYLRIMRFQKVICEIERDGFIPWNRISLESGYYDQSHFIHDFKHFSGFTPNDYMKRKTTTLNYVPVG